MRSSKSEDQLSGYEEVRQAGQWENEPNNDSQLYAADGDSGEELVTSSCLTLLESQMRPRVSTKLKLLPGLGLVNFPDLDLGGYGSQYSLVHSQKWPLSFKAWCLGDPTEFE